MSNLTVNQLTASNPTTNLISVANGDTIYQPGSVIQVIQTYISTPTAVSVPNNRAAYTSIPDFFASITPKKSTSKILVQVRWFGEVTPVGATWDSMFGIKRNGNTVGQNTLSGAGDGAVGITCSSLSYYAGDASTTPETCYFDYLDSPATTSSLTYQVYINVCNNAATLYTNRTISSGNSSSEYGCSSITLWEIAQ